MTNFQFDPALSSDENIEMFLAFMEQQKPEMTKLLRENLDQLPLPNAQAEKTARRIKFNNKIADSLDKLATSPAPKS